MKSIRKANRIKDLAWKIAGYSIIGDFAIAALTLFANNLGTVRITDIATDGSILSTYNIDFNLVHMIVNWGIAINMVLFLIAGIAWLLVRYEGKVIARMRR